MLVATRFGEVEQVHRIAAPLGMREQLTFSQDPVSVARAPSAAGANGFAFLMDHGGDENGQVYFYGGTGNVRQLTTGNFTHSTPVWSHDGKRVAFSGSERDGLSYDVYVADVSNASAPRLVVGGQQDTWYPLDWSPDDKKLLLWKFVSTEESYLYIADVAIGTFTPVDDSGRKISVNTARFAPDGRGIYLISVEDGDFAQLRYLDPVSHEERRVTPEVPWDIESFDVSVEGRYIAYVVNEDGRSRLTVVDSLQKLELTPPGLPEGQISNLRFDRTGKRLAMSVDSAQAPRDVYVYDLAHSAIERWTKSEIGAVDPAPRLRRARPLSNLGSGCRQTAHDFGVCIPAARAGRRSRGDRHTRWAGVAIPSPLGSVRAIPGERARLRGHRTERARLIGLWKVVHEARQRGAAGGCGP